MAVKSFLALTSSSSAESWEDFFSRRSWWPRQETGKHSDCVEKHANIPSRRDDDLFASYCPHPCDPVRIRPVRPIVRIRPRGRSANWPVIPFLTVLSHPRFTAAWFISCHSTFDLKSFSKNSKICQNCCHHAYLWKALHELQPALKAIKTHHRATHETSSDPRTKVFVVPQLKKKIWVH